MYDFSQFRFSSASRATAEILEPTPLDVDEELAPALRALPHPGLGARLLIYNYGLYRPLLISRIYTSLYLPCIPQRYHDP